MKRIVDMAITLRRVNYGEKDRIATMLMQNSGKVSVFVRGARGQKSKLGPGIELLTISEVTFADGRGELKMLTSATIIQHFSSLARDIDMLNECFDGLKLVDKITDDGGGQEYFDIVRRYFETLNDDRYSPQICHMWFRLGVLREAGFLGDFSVESISQDTNQVGQQLFLYDFDDQSFKISLTGTFSPNDIKLLRLLAGSKTPIVIQQQLESIDKLYALVKHIVAINIDRG